MREMGDYFTVEINGEIVLRNFALSGEDILIPDNISVIDGESFLSDGKDKIQKVEIPSSVTQIRKKAFSDMKALSQVFLSSKIEIIEDEAFDNCISLEKLRFPASLKKIGSKAFYNTGIKNCVLTDTVQIEADSFPEDCTINRIDEFGSEWF